ncbi:MAG: TonB-dependent receptor [Nitrospiraceae bacterium]|nr:MAG: TonB-dependent receptor [Nitrospiraceae bacterium]
MDVKRTCRADSVCSRLLKFFFLLSVITLPAVVFAQSEEESRMLQMYFKEDELVEAPTRTPKPLSKVAENISIITSEEIEAMNAHTVTEILERVTGLFVEFFGHDFGSGSNLYIEGSNETHVLVLVDGTPWNFLSGGNAAVNSVPVRTIKRIEVIKGPASSAWGSSLGGVINIVTKDTGDDTVPSGSLGASIGERDTHDYTAEVTGRAGIAGYYLYAGRQGSNGLRDERFFENDSFYGKIDVPFSSDIKLLLTSGYSGPRLNTGDLISSDLTSIDITRAFFTTASVAAGITDELRFEASVYRFEQKFVQDNVVLGTGLLDPAESAGDRFSKIIYDEKTDGGSAKLVWTDAVHTAVIGADVSHGKLDQTIRAGTVLQSMGVPEVDRTHPGISKWAVFFNDTMSFGDFSVTPGIRYDENNVSGEFTSPSLGATYKAGKRTVLRASVAKGFTSPPLSFTSGGGVFLDPNPNLKPEKVWSYQAGAESQVTDFLRARVTVFHHDMKNAQVKVLYAAGAPTYNDLYFNLGEIKRNGVELDAETAQFYNVSMKAGFAYVRKESYLETDTSEESTIYNYMYNLSARYDDRKTFSAQLDGHYVWWDYSSSYMAKYDTFIWDLNLRKKIYSGGSMNTDIFMTAHNLFNGSHYTLGERQNPRRWIEAGLSLKF